MIDFADCWKYYMCEIFYMFSMLAELSEAQKIALEKGNRKIQEQEKELVQLQNRITSMTKIMDKQVDEVKELKENIR